jgi:CrcB protein
LLWRRLLRALGRRRGVLAVISLGGALGSAARWGMAEGIPHEAGSFAWATFITNVSGSFLIGFLMVFVVQVWPPSRYVRPFLAVGVLGGYTTFSTYMLDTRAMLVAGHAESAAAYLVGTLVACFAAVWIAFLLAREVISLSRRRRDRHRADARGGPRDVLTAPSDAGPSRLPSAAQNRHSSRRTR